MNAAEHNLQAACVYWFRVSFPNAILYAIPNGGQRNVIVAAKLKAEGVLAGVPDIYLAEPRGGYHGLYIEMKVRGGRLQPTQRIMLERLEARGYKTAVCFSFEEFKSTITNYMSNE